MAPTASKMEHMTEAGKYSDGPGLWLSISRTGARSWVLRAAVQGKRCEMGLDPSRM